MLEHIGITINEESDIQAFYKDLLGLEEVQKFELYKDLSEKLFGISNAVSVTHLSSEDLFLELFLTDRNKIRFTIIFAFLFGTETLLSKKQNLWGFSLTQIKRESRDGLLFIRDKSGNIFEIKSR